MTTVLDTATKTDATTNARAQFSLMALQGIALESGYVSLRRQKDGSLRALLGKNGADLQLAYKFAETLKTVGIAEGERTGVYTAENVLTKCPPGGGLDNSGKLDDVYKNIATGVVTEYGSPDRGRVYVELKAAP